MVRSLFDLTMQVCQSGMCVRTTEKLPGCGLPTREMEWTRGSKLRFHPTAGAICRPL